MPLSAEQLAILAHDVNQSGRVLAGPGTGKSFTSVALLLQLQESAPTLSVRLFTFTRAATQELAKKFERQQVEAEPPCTVHAFALGLLVRNPAEARIPLPIRIPDSFEAKRIREDLARQLRGRGFDVNSSRVRDRLEREMSARWESLDPNYETVAEIDPALRRAYLGQWERHRRTFGYTLLSEIPYRAGLALEDHELDIGDIDFLIVDEYQDLNAADIRMLKLLHDRGVHVLAIGDDDQSIYSFRVAAPHGIREFLNRFNTEHDYNLTRSFRCGADILEAANDVIECATDRIRRPRLTPHDAERRNRIAYVRFGGYRAEAIGVARMIAARVSAGVPPGAIAVLVRSNVSNWSRVLKPELEERGIALAESNWVVETLAEEGCRNALALMRIVVDEEDSLAWWSLVELTRGIAAADFVRYVQEQAVECGETFGESLLRLTPDFNGAPSETSARRAAELVTDVGERATAIRTELEGPIVLDEYGWGGWVLDHIDDGTVSGQAASLLRDVGRSLVDVDSLGQFLGQLEPIGKDLATVSDQVRLMTITGSKGLTLDSCFVMGVEDGLIPDERGDLEEERRLLYVAMTRAEQLCVLTFARQRRGPVARQGRARVGRSRSRCLLLEGLPIGDFQEGEDLVQQLEAENAEAS